MTTPTLFDHPAVTPLARARAERDTAIAQVEANAGEEWLAYAREWLRDYLTTHSEFFPDAVWHEGLQEPPNDKRAFGGIVQWAARQNLIVRTGERRPRTRGHATLADVWRSNLYEGSSSVYEGAG